MPLLFSRVSERYFERAEPPLQFPLLPSLLTATQERSAGFCRLVAADRVLGASSAGLAEIVGLGPQTGSRKKAVLQPCSSHLLELGVTEFVGLRRADIFGRQVDSRHAFVISGERDRHLCFAV